jgi:NADPH2:quinone reductase
VHGVLLSYNVAPLALRKFGLQPNPPELGPKVHAALCDLIAAGAIQPIIGRRISMSEVGTTLQDHANRLTSGRSVVDLTRG